MADRNQRQQERRREAFRKSLEEIEADEIRARLADRRIRSAERVAVAEAVLRERGESLGGDGEAAGAKPSGRAMNGGEGRGRAEQAAPAAGAAPGGDEAPAEAEAGNSYARDLGYQIGRAVGMGLGVLGLAAVALLVLRR
jgi:hypothetical protein